MKRRITLPLAATLILTGCWICAPPAAGQTKIKDICHLKGQEENTLQGMGLVVGLNGTGDGAGSAPTMRALAKIMTVMRQPLSEQGLAELKNAKNVALVTVRATVPAGGAREGDKLDCVVSSIGAAKDLSGGQLFLTFMIGPDRSNNSRVYGSAQGPISLDDPAILTTGRVHDGCRLEENFFNSFTKDGVITLVLDKHHADFEVAQAVADKINNKSELSFESGGVPLAKALDRVNVEVTVPSQYSRDLVEFVSRLLGMELVELPTGARVVINERAGDITITGEVEIGAVVVTHKNVVVETGGTTAAGSFVGISPDEPEAPKLKALVAALGAVHVPTEDMIGIIKRLHRAGKLHAPLIIE